MENSKNIHNKNSKINSFKLSPKTNKCNSFEIKNEASGSILMNNNSNNKNIKEKEEIKDKPFRFKANEKLEKYNDSPLMDDFFGFSEIRSPIKSKDDQISKSLDKIIKGDDMDILSELMSLCSFLSLSSERIGYNPSLPKLIEEICKNLTKTYLPELIIYSLQSINYILDINPEMIDVLQKNKAIPSIMKTISSIEDNTCGDYVLKILEKISIQNSRILLENNIVQTLLLDIFDFLNIHQKKIIMKICINIIRRFDTNEYNTYIKPVMNIIINLIKIDNDDNNDHLFISEKATIILYNIIIFIKDGDYFYYKDKKENSLILEIITKYPIIENFIDILNKYFLKNNQIITEQLIKEILRTIVLILEISKEGMNKILSSNFLDIVSNIINNEYNTEARNNNNNNNLNIRRIHSDVNRRGLLFLSEFFDVLIALFPSKDEDSKNKKIINPENKKYYDYFCQNIFLPLFNNIMKKSTNRIFDKSIKLILSFVDNSNKNDIISFLPSKPLSQIIIKLLDTKNNNNISDSVSLVKSLLEKASENFIVSFLREGIVHKLKNLKVEPPKIELYDYNLNDSIENLGKFYINPFKKFHSRNRYIKKHKKPDFKYRKIIKNKKKIKEGKDLKDEIVDLKTEEKIKENKIIKIMNINEIDKKEKNSQENEINLDNINSDENIEKDKTKKLDDFNKEEDELMSLMEENEQEEQDEVFDDDDEDLLNEEKENIEKRELKSGDSFLSEKKSMFFPFSEEKDYHKKNYSEIKIEKVKNNEKNLEIFSPLIPTKSLKDTQIKKLDFLKEEKNKSVISNKNDDLLMKDIDISNSKEKNENEVIIEKRNLIDSPKPKKFLKKKRITDFLRYRDELDEFEDNYERLEIKSIKEELKDLMTNYLSDEKINQYLSKTENKTKDGLMKIQTTLSNYQQLLSSLTENSKNKEKYIKEIINILTDENVSITLFELENSKILLSLSNYIDPEFTNQYNKMIDDNEVSSIDKLINHLSDKNIWGENKNINLEIFEKISKFFEGFEGDKNKIIKFIKLINDSIQIMNCPIFLLNDNKRDMYDIEPMRPINNKRNISLNMEYNEQIFKDETLNQNLIIDKNFKNKLCEINTFFMMNKRTILDIYDNTSFRYMSVILLAHSNIVLITDNKYEISFKFYIENYLDEMIIEENEFLTKRKKNKFGKKLLSENKSNQNEKEIFNIDENWTYNTLIENYSKKYKRDIPYYIKFGLTLKIKENKISNIQIENNINFNNNISKGFLNYNSSLIQDSFDSYEYINFDKYCFMKDYHDNIINSENIKFSKQLMPSLYLLSLLNICINQYNKLFNLPKAWFINSDKNRKEWKNIFYNLKIDQLLFKLCGDRNTINNSSFQFLREYITKNNQSLTKFPTRLISFKTSFEPNYKSIINFQNILKHLGTNNRSNQSVTLKKTMRLKLKVERDKIIENGFDIMNGIFSKFKGYLEFEYIGEIGNGIGPTLEFYTLILDKIKEDNNLWYKTTNNTLYPRLSNYNENNEKNFELFKLLGFVLGRAIYDDRLIDIPLNKVFWDLVLEKPILFKNIKIIDSYLYKTLSDFVNLINEKKEYVKNNNIQKLENCNFDDIILFNRCKLSSLDIYFTFPGYDNIELKPQGKEILLTMNNIEEYVKLIYDFIFYRGVDKIIKSFKEGFNMNFNINKLKCFSSSEIEGYISDSLDIKWDQNILFENIIPEHGYTNQSKIFNYLIKFMINLDKNQRRQFLVFSTGCPRLPIGGFKNLYPKLTVVQKYCEENSNPDDYLPTVMTCQNYLKIPEYSSYKIFENKMLLAMKEGCNEFNLS